MSDEMMNRLNNESDFDAEFDMLDESEQSSLDALLHAAADNANASVDYAGLFERIQHIAGEEGIVAFTPKRQAIIDAKKQKSAQRVKRASQIALAFAAVCVLGLGLTTVMLGMRGFSNSTRPGGQDVYTSPSSAQLAGPTDGIVKPTASAAPFSSQAVDNTETPSGVTSDPAIKIPILTPQPTDAPFKNPNLVIQNLSELSIIIRADELLPPALPDFMTVRTYAQSFRVSAMGESKNGTTLYYDCALCKYSPYTLEIGQAAIMRLENGGYILYWHINEEQFLYICIAGLEYDEVVTLLATFYVDYNN